MHDISRHSVQEVPVVGHHQQRGGPVLQVVLQPDDGLDVQHVRRLVEEEQVWSGSEMRS